MDPSGNLLPLLSCVPVFLGGSPRSGVLPQQGAPGKHCNCKNSRCLKLYCECFASGRYCENCSCKDCLNNQENESKRQPAVDSILERNPHAFRPKIQAQAEVVIPSHTSPPVIDAVGKHSKGCNCKKSACLKKYCECFQAGVFCSSSCRCMECKNYEGSDQRAQVIACLNMPHPSSAEHGAGSGKGPFAASAPGVAASTSTSSHPRPATSPPHKRARTAAAAPPPQPFNPSLLGNALAGAALPPGLPFYLPPMPSLPTSSPPAARPIPALSVPLPIKAPTPSGRPQPPPAAPASTASAVPASSAPPVPSATGASHPAAAAQPQKWPLLHQARFEAQERVVLEEFLSTLKKILAAADQQVAELQAASKQQRQPQPNQPPHSIPTPPPAAQPTATQSPADGNFVPAPPLAPQPTTSQLPADGNFVHQRQSQHGSPGKPSKSTAPPLALPLELPAPRGLLPGVPMARQAPPPPVATPGLHFTQPPPRLGTSQGQGEGLSQGQGQQQQQQPHHQGEQIACTHPPAGVDPATVAVALQGQRQGQQQGDTTNEQPGG
ncbi:hypothetical protein DUNSADRAFT_11038 [Dunaliella salina]|uniref:CRC domain-containing protein n=1 Tax=Dunaliella salina TaxID=3046 RepID=A0ABQ7GE63_DUNSA|nr:hypothetical protein DUNSADRAFT_11038 [Dunaliella salina]|eukprot:KAF5832888.1 hypothetical protein DUNSADRAFT_11038 [Dunaliella salina]